MTAQTILPANSVVDSGFNVANSVRFTSGDYLDHTHGAVTSTRKQTYSVWVKRGKLSAYGYIIATRNGTDTNRDGIAFSDADQIDIRYNAGNSSPIRLTTNRLFRDASAWYHIVVAVDTTQGTAANRIKLYVNGVQETSFATANYMDQNYDFALNAKTDQTTDIGNDTRSDGSYFDGYMAEFVALDGSQNAPTDFGEADEDSGIWKPIDPSGLTFGNAGFYMNFQTAAELGTDVSGNSNTFAENNLPATDQSTDTCTNNFCLINPLSTVFTENISSMLSEGNTQYDPTGNYSIVKATIPFPQSGKFYIESKLGSGNLGGQFGIQRLPATSSSTNSYLGYNTNEAAYAYTHSGEFQRSSGGSGDTRTALTTGLTSWGAGNTLAILFNADDNEIKFYLQDSLKYTLDLSSAPHGYYANDGEWVFAISAYGNDQIHNVNFGNPSVSITSGNTDGNGYGNFEYSTKGGYALCTKNLAEYG